MLAYLVERHAKKRGRGKDLLGGVLAGALAGEMGAGAWRRAQGLLDAARMALEAMERGG